MWNDTEIAALCQEKSPGLIWPIWDGLSPVQRADVFRYLVLWDQGGYYADIDVRCHRPVADFPVPKDSGTKFQGYFPLASQMLQYFLPYMPLASGELHAASTDVQDVLVLRKAASWRAVSGGDVLYHGEKRRQEAIYPLPPGGHFAVAGSSFSRIQWSLWGCGKLFFRIQGSSWGCGKLMFSSSWVLARFDCQPGSGTKDGR